jgi:hypothetical protein
VPGRGLPFGNRIRRTWMSVVRTSCSPNTAGKTQAFRGRIAAIRFTFAAGFFWLEAYGLLSPVMLISNMSIGHCRMSINDVMRPVIVYPLPREIQTSPSGSSGRGTKSVRMRCKSTLVQVTNVCEEGLAARKTYHGSSERRHAAGDSAPQKDLR